MPVKGYTSLTVPKETSDKLKEFADSKGMASSTEFIKWLIRRYEDPEVRAFVDGVNGIVSRVEWTEWPGPYEQIIKNPKVKYYCSTSWIRSEGYLKKVGGPQWIVDARIRDEGDFRVEKMFVISRKSWGADGVWKWIGRWLSYANPFAFGDKVEIFVVKESDAREKKIDDKYYDMGIYGDQLVGFLNLDEESDPILPNPYAWVRAREDMERAAERFEKLKSISYPLRNFEDFEKLRKKVYD